MVVFGLMSLVVMIGVGVLHYYDIKYKKQEEVKVIKCDIKESLDKTGIPFVKVMINNKDFNFMVDTGASNCYIDDNIISDFNCEKLEENNIITASGDIQKSNKVKLQFKVLNLVVNCNFQAYDMSKINDSYIKHNLPKIDGILGIDFLRTIKANIDFNDNCLSRAV